MAIQWSVGLRNHLLDQYEAYIGTSARVQFWTGSMPANAAAAATGTKVAEFTLPSDWAAAASAGSKSFSTPFNTIGLAAGNIGYYRITDSAGTTCHEQGTVTISGGGGDMIVDNVSITAGQNVSITSWSKSAPSA